MLFSRFIPVSLVALVPMLVQAMVVINPSASSITASVIQQKSSVRHSVGYVTTLSGEPDYQNHIVEPDQFDFSAYTHVMFSFLTVDTTCNEITLIHPKHDDVYIRSLVGHVRSNYPGVKVGLSVINLDADYPNEEVEPIEPIVTNLDADYPNEELKPIEPSPKSEKSLETIVASAVKLVKEYGVDGIDLFSDNAVAKRDDPYTQHLVSLAQEIRAAFGTEYTLSAMIPEGGDWSDSIDGISVLAPHVDFITMMAVDISEKETEKASVLQPYNDIRYVKDQIQVAVDAGVPVEKLLLSIRFSSDVYKQATLFQYWNTTATPFNTPSFRFAIDEKALNYHDISDINAHRREKMIPQFYYHDRESFSDVVGFGINHRDITWVAYRVVLTKVCTSDGPESVAKRVQFSKGLGMGGVSVLCVEGDDGDFTLSKAIRTAME